MIDPKNGVLFTHVQRATGVRVLITGGSGYIRGIAAGHVKDKILKWSAEICGTSLIPDA